MPSKTARQIEGKFQVLQACRRAVVELRVPAKWLKKMLAPGYDGLDFKLGGTN